MARHAASQNDPLFSHDPAQPESKKMIARALETDHGDHFRSAIFTDADHESGIRQRVWQEAERSPTGHGWDLIEYKHVPDARMLKHETTAVPMAENRTTRYESICLFDALHACGTFEIAMAERGLITEQDTEQDSAATDIMHYKDLAASCGIPCDNDGLPLLAANGRLQDDGQYSPEARTIAKKSPAVTPETIKSIFDDLATGTGTALIKAPLSVPAPLTRDQITARVQIETLPKAIDQTTKSLHHCLKHKFSWILDRATFGCLLIPAIGQGLGIASYSRGWGDFPRRCFHKAANDLARQTALKIDSQKITLGPVADFLNEARLAYHMLYAHTAYKQYTHRNRSLSSYTRCMAAFEKAAARQGWDEAKINRYKTPIMDTDSGDEFEYRVMKALDNKAETVKKWLENEAVAEICPAMKTLPAPRPVVPGPR